MIDRERNEEAFKCWCPNREPLPKNVVRIRTPKRYTINELCSVCMGTV